MNKIVDGVVVLMTDAEETARDAEETAWTNGALARAMNTLRTNRNRKIVETDYHGGSIRFYTRLNKYPKLNLITKKPAFAKLSAIRLKCPQSLKPLNPCAKISTGFPFFDD